jgi:hypothetical protein
MQCDNCGYIFFQPSKKCTCCSAPYAPAQSAFDVGQESLFTIFEMAAGEGGIPVGMGMAGSAAGVEDYNFTDDFDTGEAEYGVDENVLDLSDAEAEGFGVGTATEAMGIDDFSFDTSGMDNVPSLEEDAGSDDFNLNLSDDSSDSEEATIETLEAEPAAVEADNALDLDFSDGFDEVEGLGFGLDESPAAETPEVDAETISLDDSSESEISLDLDVDDEEPSLELSDEPELVIDDEEPSLELSEDLDLSDEPELMDASEEVELMDDVPMEGTSEVEDDGGIEFDLDGVDLDEPEEEIAYEVPEAEVDGEEPSMDFDGLELEMESPDEPEDEELKP